MANAALSAELALDVGRAVALACAAGRLGSAPSPHPSVVIGRDTRCSGPLLEAALVAGLCSGGAHVLRAGVLPTPGVAYLIDELSADAGVVVSASHNPPADNGIKLFGSGAWKLHETAEDAVESLLGTTSGLPVGKDVGWVADVEDARSRYIDHLCATVRADLRGIRVVADCAHGAACNVAGEVLSRLGAQTVLLNAEPSGERINIECGATHPEVVAAEAARRGAIGLTFDGDADRVLAADETGHVVDGDAILAILAQHQRRQRDPGAGAGGGAVVATVMANQAFRRWCDEHQTQLVETPVGDRFVLEAMRELGVALGGEQSGHVIRLDLATTGDGILTGLGLLEAVAAAGGRLADIVPFRPYPQVLVNVRTAASDRLAGADRVWAAVSDAEQVLGDEGRILVRSSGTEPLVRVMVEARSHDDAERTARAVAAVVQRELDGHG